jgi:hypothetical protein
MDYSNITMLIILGLLVAYLILKMIDVYSGENKDDL